MTIFILVIQNIYKINKKTAKRHSSGGDQKTITQNNLFLHVTLKNTKELQNLSKINKEAPRKVEWNSRVLFFNEGQKILMKDKMYLKIIIGCCRKKEPKVLEFS